MNGMRAAVSLGRPPVWNRQRLERLDSWNAIATHLNRTVRTVQRWERTCGMPVHRDAGRSRSRVYAFAWELDEWWHQRDGNVPAAPVDEILTLEAEIADCDAGRGPEGHVMTGGD